MKRTTIAVFILLCIPILLNAWADWQSVSNQHFRIYFKGQWENEARNAMKTMEYYRPQLEELTGGSKKQIPITLEDLGNEINGYTDPFGTRIALFAYPPTSDNLAVCENWWQLVGSHEYIHMLQMTREYGFTRMLRVCFSNYFYPELWQPGWMTEGITVYGESQLSRYTGRLNGGTYRSIITTLAKKDKLPSMTKAAYYSIDTPQANYYTFGGAFFAYLAETYGDSKFTQIYDETSASTLAYLNGILPLANLDGAFLSVYGKPLMELWADWIAYEKQQEYSQPIRQVTSDGWFKSDLQVVNNKLYYIVGKTEKTGPGSGFFSNRLYQVDIPDPVVLDDKMPTQVFPNNMIKPIVLIEQNTDFHAGYHILNDNLYYSRTELQTGYANNEMDGYGGSIQLFKLNITTGLSEKLYQGQVRAFLPMADGSILISEDNDTHTGSVLYKLNTKGKDKFKIYESTALIHNILPYLNKYILGVKNNWQNCSIYYFDPLNLTLEPIINTPFYTTPVSISGDTLIFNAVFDGKTGAYAYNLKERFCYRLGSYDDVRCPVILPHNRNLFISLNDLGYDIYQDELFYTPYCIPDEEIPGAPYIKPNETELAIKILPTGRFNTYLRNLSHMLVPRLLHMPILAGTGDSLAIGCALSGNDVVGDFPAWSATAIYDTKYSRFKYGINLTNNFFRPIKQVFGYSNLDKQSLSSTQSITLHRQANYGLKAVNLGFSFQTKDDYQRKIWNPFFDFEYGWAKGSVFTRQYFPYETKDFFPSDRNRLGWQSLLQYHQKMPLSSEIKVMTIVANDQNAEPDEVFGKIRGYDDAFETNQGAFIQTSWYRPLIIIREGLWNPQIYVEDIDIGLFCDAALSSPYKETLRQTSCGIELISELSLAYYLNLNLGIRYSYNKDNVTLGQFFVNTLF